MKERQSASGGFFICLIRGCRECWPKSNVSKVREVAGFYNASSPKVYKRVEEILHTNTGTEVHVVT